MWNYIIQNNILKHLVTGNSNWNQIRFVYIFFDMEVISVYHPIGKNSVIVIGSGYGYFHQSQPCTYYDSTCPREGIDGYSALVAHLSKPSQAWRTTHRESIGASSSSDWVIIAHNSLIYFDIIILYILIYVYTTNGLPKFSSVSYFCLSENFTKILQKLGV